MVEKKYTKKCKKWLTAYTNPCIFMTRKQQTNRKEKKMINRVNYLEAEAEKTYTQEEAEAAILKYFEENTDEFEDAIEALDAWNGYLGDDRYYYMSEIDEFYSEPSEVLTRAFYGWDEEYTDADGRHTESFNPNREYFRYNGYGNLVSSDYKDYSDHLDIWFIRAYIENAGNLCNVPDDVQDIIDRIEA